MTDTRSRGYGHQEGEWRRAGQDRGWLDLVTVGYPPRQQVPEGLDRARAAGWPTMPLCSRLLLLQRLQSAWSGPASSAVAYTDAT